MVNVPDRPVSATRPNRSRHARRSALAALPVWAAAVAPSVAHGALFHGETLDKVADIVSWAVLVLVPVIVIVVFWVIHVLPEKIAHKRHHPQRQAIQTLCLLSLVFGGLLWPIAWLWAYTRPVGYKLAYGTDKHEDYFEELGEKAHAGELIDQELAHFRDELDAMHARGALPAHLAKLRDEVAQLAASPPAVPVEPPRLARTGSE